MAAQASATITLLRPAAMRARAATYRDAAKRAGDPRTRERCLAMAKRLEQWAAQADARQSARGSAS